jgi:hypothetical protein
MEDKRKRIDQLLYDFETKIERFEDMPVEVAVSPVNACDLVSLMKDLLEIFKAMS